MAPIDALANLRLTAAQRRALQEQGFVSAERRKKRTVYKLRFRLEGRQQVISLGSDRAQAQQVSTALHKLQAPRRAKQALKTHVQKQRQAWSRLRDNLDQVSVHTRFHRHGRRLRRRRDPVPEHLNSRPIENSRDLSGDTPVVASTSANSSAKEFYDADNSPPVATPGSIRWEQKEQQTLLQVLEASAASLTALQNVVGLVTAELLWLLTCYREDLAAWRAQLEHPADRLALSNQHIQGIYNLAKQIDAFARTQHALSRESRNATVSKIPLPSRNRPASVEPKETVAARVRPR